MGVAIAMVMLLWLTLGGCDDPALEDAIGDDGAQEVVQENSLRIVTLGGPITEIVFALGAGDSVVAVDESSEYPEETTSLLVLGYFRNSSVEGVLEQRPDLILTSEGVGPAGIIAQWEAAGVEVHVFDEPLDPEQAAGRIEEIGEILGASETEEVLEQMANKVEEASELAKNIKARPRVLFLYARGQGTVMVGGQDTGASEMIEMAGGELAVDFEGFRPVGAEGLIAARPDIVVMTTRGLESLGGAEKIWELEGMGTTPAADNQAIVTVEDLKLLGFGPRMGSALMELSTSFAAVGIEQ